MAQRSRARAPKEDDNGIMDVDALDTPRAMPGASPGKRAAASGAGVDTGRDDDEHNAPDILGSIKSLLTTQTSEISTNLAEGLATAKSQICAEVLEKTEKMFDSRFAPLESRVSEQEARLEKHIEQMDVKFAQLQNAFTVHTQEQKASSEQSVAAIKAATRPNSNSKTSDWDRAVDVAGLVVSGKKMFEQKEANELLFELCGYAGIPIDPIPFKFTSTKVCDRVHKVHFTGESGAAQRKKVLLALRAEGSTAENPKYRTLIVQAPPISPPGGGPPEVGEDIPVSINKDENGKDRCMAFNLRVLRRILGKTFPHKTFWFDFDDGSVKWNSSHLLCLRVKAESADTITLQFNPDALVPPESSGLPSIGMDALRAQFKATSPNSDIQWCS